MKRNKLKAFVLMLGMTATLCLGITTTQAQEGDPNGSVCYNGYENPSWWYNDNFRRDCEDCGLLYGHGWVLPGHCNFSPT